MMRGGSKVVHFHAHEVEDAGEVLVAVVFDFDAALFGGMVDADVGAEAIAEAVGDLGDEGGGFAIEFVAAFDDLAVGRFVLEILDEFFAGADGEPATEDFLGGGLLGLLVADAEEGLGVADADLSAGEEVLHVFLEVEEAHGIGDGGAGLADAFGDVLLLHLELLGEADVAGGFLDGVEVLALEVLDEGHLEDLAVGGFAGDDGDRVDAEFGAGPPAAFTGDEFEFVADGADDEGLDDAMLADRVEQFVELFLRDAGAGLEGAGDNLVEGDVLDLLSVAGGVAVGGAFRCGVDPLFDERAKSFSQCRFSHVPTA